MYNLMQDSEITWSMLQMQLRYYHTKLQRYIFIKAMFLYRPLELLHDILEAPSLTLFVYRSCSTERYHL